MIICDLFGKAFSNISAQAYIQLVIFQNMIDKRSSGCFSVASGNGYYFGIGKF